MPEPLSNDELQRLAWAACMLGLVPPFTLQTARDRYRDLAKVYHPDAGRTADSARFTDVGEAMRLVEENEAFFRSNRLGWDLGQSGLIADWIEKVAEAERKLAQKEADIIRLRSEQDHMRRESGRRKGVPTLLIIGGYVALLLVVSVCVALLVARAPDTIRLGGRSLSFEKGTIALVRPSDQHSTVSLSGLCRIETDVAASVQITSASLVLPTETSLSFFAPTRTLSLSHDAQLLIDCDVRLDSVLSTASMSLPSLRLAVQPVRLDDVWQPQDPSKHWFTVLRQGEAVLPPSTVGSTGWTLSAMPYVPVCLHKGFGEVVIVNDAYTTLPRQSAKDVTPYVTTHDCSGPREEPQRPSR